MSNVIVSDGIFIHEHTIASGSRHVGAFAGYAWNLRFLDCHSQRNTIIGMEHVGGFMGEYETAFFTDCSSEKNTVLAFGGHSGAFASCSNTWGEFTRCWSNSDIYGNAQVGGFTSGCDGANTGKAYTEKRGAVYRDCFSSGVVEGNQQIGGFVGFSYVYDAAKNSPELLPRYERCYSTSMVGMNYNGSILGGFVGNMLTGTFKDCYAAGEVGSIDTDINSTNDIGGFAGVFGNSAYITPVVQNCFYDMQTTAMRNKAYGSSSLLSMVRDDSGVYTTSWSALRGFTTKKMTGECNIFASGYTYTSGLYPQLSSMASHENIKFRAQSATSAATVFCDDWSDISKTGFDTVRDTMRNYSFSSAEDFGSNDQFKPAYIESDNIASVIWSKDGNVSPIDWISPVIQMSERPYYTTSLAPGVEWVEVELEYSDDSGTSSTGHRRLRLIPTSVIETGGDKRVDVFYDGDSNETSPYDHKEGFATTYLDAATLQSYLESDTVHPEALKTFEQIVSQQYSNGIISGTMELPFNSTVKNLAVTASMTDQNGNLASIDNLFEKLNGTQRFEAQDCGIYKIVYRASLTDGRYLSIGKKLIVVGPWSVVYNYNYDGLLSGDKISPDSVFYIQSNLMDFNGFVFEGYEATPMRDGYQFAYWSFDREGRQPVNQEWFDQYESRYGTLNQNIDVYAQWNRIAPTNPISITIDPLSGSYDSKSPNEKTILTGEPGERVIVGAALPPDGFLFDGWSGDDLGGGTLEYCEETRTWIFTFGNEDANLLARYQQNVFTTTIQWVNKHTGEEIASSRADDLEVGGMISFRTDVVDFLLYDISSYDIKIYDADTNDELQHSELSLVCDELDRYGITAVQPNRNIRIEVAYDTLIQMPETGMPALAFLILAGMLLTLSAMASVAFYCGRCNERQ